jgi:cytochrome c biogenesis protein CcmG, thiol:disulfide interchange protein DsbE
MSGALGAPLVGLNWRDRDEAAQKWLADFGNPYTVSVTDPGPTAIDYGVYGAPETFVIDSKGIVRDKVIGVVDATVIEKRLKPLLQQLNNEAKS